MPTVKEIPRLRSVRLDLATLIAIDPRMCEGSRVAVYDPTPSSQTDADSGRQTIWDPSPNGTTIYEEWGRSQATNGSRISGARGTLSGMTGIGGCMPCEPIAQRILEALCVT